MIDPTTMTDSALRARIDDEIHDAPRLKAAAERATKELEENTAAIRVLQAEAAFRATVKELRRKSSAARLAVLRALAEEERPIDVDGPTEWLISRKLICAHRSAYSYSNKYSYSISNLGRRAFTLLEST